MDAQDLTHAEAVEAFLAFEKRAGSNVSLYVSLAGRFERSQGALTARLYPEGITRECAARIGADTYAELLAAVEAKWAELSAEFAEKKVRDIALAIISITADAGECTEAALAQKFDAATVAALGDRACAEATRLVGGAPFQIVLAASESEAA